MPTRQHRPEKCFPFSHCCQKNDAVNAQAVLLAIAPTKNFTNPLDLLPRWQFI
jgi:hypothetical protein